MSIKPILMNTEMVRAILDGRKTVTRRIVKLKYSNTHLEMRTGKYGARLIELQNEEPGVTTIKNPDGTTTHTLLSARVCHPPYRPGDVLWVRETWAHVKFGRGEWHYEYRANCEHPKKWSDGSFAKWNPSIYMPREAARIWLRVTDVRVERLQEIDGNGLRAEGFDILCLPNEVEDQLNKYGAIFDLEQAKKSFSSLWDSTIKPADRERYGWAANPWVWVIEFERCEKPEEADADA